MTDEAWIDTVRLARDLGNVSVLLPPGVKTLLDLPHPLFRAVRFALMVMGWDELADDERPPRRIWLDGAKLKTWFAAVKRRRQEKYGGAKDDLGDDAHENLAAKGLIVG